MSADNHCVNETVTSDDDDVIVVIDPYKHAGVLALFGLGVSDLKASLDKYVRDKNITSTVHLLGSKTSTEFVGGSPVLVPEISDAPTTKRRDSTTSTRSGIVDRIGVRRDPPTRLTYGNARNLRRKTKNIECKILADMNSKPEIRGALTFGQERRRARLLRVLKKLNDIANGTDNG